MSFNLTIIAIVGMAGSGKSEASQYFKSKKLPVLRFGDQTEAGLKKLDLPLTQANEARYRENLRKKLGMSAYAQKIAPRIKKALKKHPTVILDGLYSWEEYLYLKKIYPQLILLCIYTRPNIRHQRLKTRKVRPLGWKQAGLRDKKELENLNKGGPIAMADYLIINHGSKKDFHQKLGRFLHELH